MAHIVADRVYDTTTTTGTGAVTVSGSAPSGYRTFSAVLTTNDTCYYAIAHQTAAEWEVGLGTYSASNQLTRTTILSSSNANNAVNFSAGTKDIYITDPAARDNQNLYGATTDTAIAKFNGTNGQLQDSAVLIDSSNNIKNAITLGLGSSSDVLLGRNAAANLRLGAADAAAPVAQTLSVQSVVTGTSNTAGTNFTIAGSKGTGTGAGGSILFQTAAAGASGTSQNALATAMTIDGSGIVAIGTTPVTGANVLLGKNITGAATNAWAFRIISTVQPDVTGNAQVNNTFISTASNGGTPYTISNIWHYFANQSTFHADSTVSIQMGFRANSTLISATNNYGFYCGNTASVTTGKVSYGFFSDVNTATGGGTTYGFYANGTANNVMPNLSGGIGAASTLTLQSTTGAGTTDAIIFKTASQSERMRIRSDGGIGVGTTGDTASSFHLGRAITGASQSYGIINNGTIQPTVSTALYSLTQALTASNGGTPYTVTQIAYDVLAQSTFHADSTVTLQYGFLASGVGAALIGATNNYNFYCGDLAGVTTGKTAYGFYSSVNAATGGGTAYGFYAAGTANNYFGGNVGIGTAPSNLLHVYRNNTATSAQVQVEQDGTGNANIGFLLTGVYAWLVGADATDNYFKIAASGTGLSTNTRLTIDTSGNVGIGTDSPSTTLDIYNSSNASMNITSDTSASVGITRCSSDVSAPQIILQKSRGTNASKSAVQAGDVCGSFLSQAFAGTNFRPIANIRGVCQAIVSDTNISGYLQFLTTNASTTQTERMRISSGGLVSIGTAADGTALLTLAAGTSTANTAPLKFTSGTNLTTPEAGVIEYDGTIMSATTNTNFKRGTIPVTNYSTGTGTALGTNTEATLAVLLPAANDTITLSIGTYFLDITYIVTRGASTTAATSLLNIRGTGNAVGTFSGIAIGSATNAGAGTNYSFNAVTITTDNTVAPSSNTSGGIYVIHVRGILKVTTSGTIIPQYRLSVNINGAGTVSNVFAFKIQQLDTQSAAAFGPAGTGWG